MGNLVYLRRPASFLSESTCRLGAHLRYICAPEQGDTDHKTLTGWRRLDEREKIEGTFGS